MSRAAEPVDAVVIGAGVVGLAVARALAIAGREVIVLEAEAEIEQALGFPVCFVPHLLPVRRGLIATCYVQTDADVRELMVRALKDPERGYGKRKVQADDEALDHLAKVAGGDARNALNALELAV